MFFHEIFYYTIRLFVVASHLLLITPRFTLYIYRTLNKLVHTYETLLYFAMASSSGVFGNLFAGKSGTPSQALTLRDFTIARTSSALQPVGDTDVGMVTPGKRIVTAPAWLSFMYAELQKEIEYMGNVILEIQRQEQNPRHITADICAAYELTLSYQRQLYESESVKLRNALREDYLRFEAASK